MRVVFHEAFHESHYSGDKFDGAAEPGQLFGTTGQTPSAFGLRERVTYPLGRPFRSFPADSDQGMTTLNTHEATVYVVDDDPSVLRMLEALVATIGVDVQAFPSAREFLAAYRAKPCHCLVCDLRMPEIDGMELQKRLKAMDAAPPIIFLTGFAEVNIAVDAMKHGAFDFLEKPFGAQALLGKIQSALDRSRIDYAKWLEHQATEARLALLTPKERDVIRYVVEGKSSREISEQLGISIRTVENHRTRIMEKLHVETTVELVKLFL